MNQINVIGLSVIIAAMFLLTQGKLDGGRKHAQSVIAEQTTPIEQDLPQPDTIKQNWLPESAKRLERWYAFHSQSIKGFKSNDFVLVDTFHDVEFTQLDVTKTDPAMAKYRFASPDGKKQLDIYCYGTQLLPDKNGQIELAAQNLESEAAIYGLAENKKLRMLFCGDACHFEDATWINNDMFLVAGTSSEVDEKNHPMLWGVQLSTRSVFRFLHPGVVEVAPKSYFNSAIISR